MKAIIRKAVTIAALCGSLLMAGSAFAQKVSTDYDRAADFGNYRTYSWAMSTNPAKEPLWEQRIMQDVDRQMAAKGFTKVDSNPDVYITYNGEMKEKVSLQGFGTGGRWVGGSFSVNKYTEREGTLIIDMYDAHSKQLVWRGVATETASDKADKNIAKLEKVVVKLFKQYPPKPNGGRS